VKTSSPKNLLVVEDEPLVCRSLLTKLTRDGYNVELVHDGQEALARALDSCFDLMVLDVTLPGLDGFEVIRQLRAASLELPVLILTAHGDATSRVRGLDTGADDYMTKPFDFDELTARIRALLRRSDARRPVSVARGLRPFGRFLVDLGRRTLECDKKAVPLAGKEFELLRYLIEHPHRPLSRQELLRAVWSSTATSTRTVDVHIAWLRRKLEDSPENPRHILTVHGVGYQFAP
jgi:DNA-binding response OmpR family regulator